MSSELSNVKPSYLANVETQVDNSDLAQFSKPPRIKIVQAQTGPPIKPPHKEGDVIVLPQNVKIADGENAFTFVPVAFFPSWVCMNPIQMKGQLQAIREYSLDPLSELAQKCKKFAKEKCPENPEYGLKYMENLNLLICIEDNPEFSDIPFHIFFAGGEYQTGQKLIGHIQARKAPRYACRFRAATSLHTGKKGTWQGLDIMNDPQPWVSEENYHKYEKLYDEMKKLIDSRVLELGDESVDVPESSEF